MSEPTRPARIRVSGEPPTISRLPTRYEREHEDPGTATAVILVVLAVIALVGLGIALHLMQVFA